jgi:hypothetical protein
MASIRRRVTIWSIWLMIQTRKIVFPFSLAMENHKIVQLFLTKLGTPHCGWLPNGRLVWHTGRSFGQNCIIHFFSSVPDEYWRSLSLYFYVTDTHADTHTLKSHSHTPIHKHGVCVKKNIEGALIHIVLEYWWSPRFSHNLAAWLFSR